VQPPIPDHERAELLGRWRADALDVPEGWTFSHLAGRLTEDQPPWDYAAACRTALHGAGHVLDMGTGGGEFLRTLADALPSDTVATEGWEPNVPVATANLAAVGIPVIRYHAEADPPMPMPFPANRFDLVLNRHESFDVTELARVLAPGGVFLTQQVGGDDSAEFHDIFGGVPGYPDHTLQHAAGQLQEAGFRIEESASWHGRYQFADVGALVSYLALTPWDVPEDFGVDAYADTLVRLHAGGPARGKPLTFTKSRFWLRAVLPDAA
jgi:SAM-dependent methyltransferase